MEQGQQSAKRQKIEEQPVFSLDDDGDDGDYGDYGGGGGGGGVASISPPGAIQLQIRDRSDKEMCLNIKNPEEFRQLILLAGDDHPLSAFIRECPESLAQIEFPAVSLHSLINRLCGVIDKQVRASKTLSINFLKDLLQQSPTITQSRLSATVSNSVVAINKRVQTPLLSFEHDRRLQWNLPSEQAISDATIKAIELMNSYMFGNKPHNVEFPFVRVAFGSGVGNRASASMQIIRPCKETNPGEFHLFTVLVSGNRRFFKDFWPAGGFFKDVDDLNFDVLQKESTWSDYFEAALAKVRGEEGNVGLQELLRPGVINKACPGIAERAVEAHRQQCSSEDHCDNFYGCRKEDDSQDTVVTFYTKKTRNIPVDVKAFLQVLRQLACQKDKGSTTTVSNIKYHVFLHLYHAMVLMEVTQTTRYPPVDKQERVNFEEKESDFGSADQQDFSFAMGVCQNKPQAYLENKTSSFSHPWRFDPVAGGDQLTFNIVPFSAKDMREVISSAPSSAKSIEIVSSDHLAVIEPLLLHIIRGKTNSSIKIVTTSQDAYRVAGIVNGFSQKQGNTHVLFNVTECAKLAKFKASIRMAKTTTKKPIAIVDVKQILPSTSKPLADRTTNSLSTKAQRARELVNALQYKRGKNPVVVVVAQEQGIPSITHTDQHHLALAGSLDASVGPVEKTQVIYLTYRRSLALNKVHLNDATFQAKLAELLFGEKLADAAKVYLKGDWDAVQNASCYNNRTGFEYKEKGTGAPVNTIFTKNVGANVSTENKKKFRYNPRPKFSNSHFIYLLSRFKQLAHLKNEAASQPDFETDGEGESPDARQIHLGKMDEQTRSFVCCESTSFAKDPLRCLAAAFVETVLEGPLSYVRTCVAKGHSLNLDSFFADPEAMLSKILVINGNVLSVWDVTKILFTSMQQGDPTMSRSNPADLILGDNTRQEFRVRYALQVALFTMFRNPKTLQKYCNLVFMKKLHQKQLRGGFTLTRVPSVLRLWLNEADKKITMRDNDTFPEDMSSYINYYLNLARKSVAENPRDRALLHLTNSKGTFILFLICNFCHHEEYDVTIDNNVQHFFEDIVNSFSTDVLPKRLPFATKRTGNKPIVLVVPSSRHQDLSDTDVFFSSRFILTRRVQSPSNKTSVLHIFYMSPVSVSLVGDRCVMNPTRDESLIVF